MEKTLTKNLRLNNIEFNTKDIEIKNELLPIAILINKEQYNLAVEKLDDLIDFLFFTTNRKKEGSYFWNNITKLIITISTLEVLLENKKTEEYQNFKTVYNFIKFMGQKDENNELYFYKYFENKSESSLTHKMFLKIKEYPNKVVHTAIFLSLSKLSKYY